MTQQAVEEVAHSVESIVHVFQISGCMQYLVVTKPIRLGGRVSNCHWHADAGIHENVTAENSVLVGIVADAMHMARSLASAQCSVIAVDVHLQQLHSSIHIVCYVAGMNK